MSRWSDGSIPGMRDNCSYSQYKGTDRTKGVARLLREIKHDEADVRNEFTLPQNRASFRRMTPEQQAELLNISKPVAEIPEVVV